MRIRSNLGRKSINHSMLGYAAYFLPVYYYNIHYLFLGNYAVIEQNLGLLQQSMAVVQMLKSPNMSQIELFMNLEKQVLENIATSKESTSVLHQVLICILLVSLKYYPLIFNISPPLKYRAKYKSTLLHKMPAVL